MLILDRFDLVERADGGPEALATKGHGTQADFGNEEAGAAERVVAHVITLKNGIEERKTVGAKARGGRRGTAKAALAPTESIGCRKHPE